MSTINRIEIANFLNLNGEGESEAWDPRYRVVTFNFHGQSTALNMTNGVGKTSNVEAWLALLTRDPQLISRTREKMAPERDGYYSHIRIEFVVPERGTAAQDDFFVQQGSPVAGKETWVFGMYGYRSAGSINFYYYRGSLEQVPVADTTGGAVTLLPNKEFRAVLKAAERNRHNPVREDWIAELSLHVSPSACDAKRNIKSEEAATRVQSCLLLRVAKVRIMTLLSSMKSSPQNCCPGSWIEKEKKANTSSRIPSSTL